MNGGPTSATAGGPRPGSLRAALTHLLYPEVALGAVFLAFALAAVSETRAAEGLALISGHYETGEALPQALLDKMLAAKNFQSGLMMVRQLEFSLFDFELHATHGDGRSVL